MLSHTEIMTSRSTLGIHSLTASLSPCSSRCWRSPPLYPIFGFTLVWKSVIPLLLVIAASLLGWM